MAALAAASRPALAQDKPALQRILERGSLIVGVYNEMPPFHAAGKGIDVALAAAGQASEPLPVPRMRDGWVVGMAFKKENEDLAFALQAAVNRLTENGELGRLFAAGKMGWRKP